MMAATMSVLFIIISASWDIVSVQQQVFPVKRRDEQETAGKMHEKTKTEENPIKRH